MLVCLLVASCAKQSGYRIATEQVDPIEVVRFDTLLMQYVQLDDTLQMKPMADACGDFWSVYNRLLLGLDDAPYYIEGLSRFMGDSIIAPIYADVQREYADMSAECEQLAQLVARYEVLFPERSTPLLQTHVSGLNRSIVTIDSLLSISLDCYLGAAYPLYEQRYHKYELPLHGRERILPDVAEVLLRNALQPAQGGTLLDAMVYEGRIAYLMSGLIDDCSAEAVLGYTPQEAAWCSDYEQKIWTAIVEQSHLFATDNTIVRKYIQPAPFTATLTQDAPGRVGRWVGWRIVEAYARNCGVTPVELATDTTTATEVLRLSGYMGK